MSNEYQAKIQDFQSSQATMSDLMKQTKAKEITDLEERIKNFQTSAEEELRKKESVLLEPILTKARTAIKEVADKNGYSHVFDSASGIVLHAPDTDNLLPLVKKHLGLGL
jgi:outer membrane protein